jgi:hypothetical protein
MEYAPKRSRLFQKHPVYVYMLPLYSQELNAREPPAHSSNEMLEENRLRNKEQSYL